MITLEVKYLGRLLDKTRGLIQVKPVYPVYFKTHFGIHTFGLKYPIDVVILDNQFRVVKTACGLKTNRIFTWPIQYSQVVELPRGTIDKENIKIGDQVKLKLI